VSYIDGYLFDGELWILMEFCEGGSLSDLHDITKTNLSEIETRAVMASCILGLEHLHNLKNIHRDIKAGNILITADGKAKLADFGVSAQLTNSKNMRKTMIGTPFWMAPELIQETLYDGKADIWSLGITILEVVEGRPPHFNVHPMRAIFMIPMKPAPRFAEPEKWSPEMSDFLGKCLTKEVDARWSARDLVHHQWIAGDVEIAKQFQGMEALRKLVSVHVVFFTSESHSFDSGA
jgi:serine/threonine kinase 3